MTSRWISKPALLLLHAESLAEHGGSPGIRDEGLFDSALARPQNLVACGQPDVAALAASYGWGIARNHPFIDGNKRTGFVAAELFLRLNGQVLCADDASCVLTMLAVAAGDLCEADFATWLRAHSAARG